MTIRKSLSNLLSIVILLTLLIGYAPPVSSQTTTPPPPSETGGLVYVEDKITAQDIQDAALAAKAAGYLPGLAGVDPSRAAFAMDPGGIPHYYGPFANYANSPMPKGPVGIITVDVEGSGYTAPVVEVLDVYGTGSGATATATVTGGRITSIALNEPGVDYTAPIISIEDPTGSGAIATAVLGSPLSGGIRKFIDALPGLGVENANEIGQYIPVAIPDKVTYPGEDYYEIELGRYQEQLHTDLPPTWLQGYRQTNTSDPTVSEFHYLGPMIIAEKDVPVRIKFTNNLPTNGDGNLFLPVDTTIMGAGEGALNQDGTDCDMMHGMGDECAYYSENRATIHLHGGFVPWISDGTPHQWTTPANEDTPYPQGVSVEYVPDMWFEGGTVVPDTIGVTTPPSGTASNSPGEGTLTFYYNNQQSSRLMFYHDHSWGITRLNVYAGEAAGYIITDEIDQDLINGTNNSGVNPGLVQVLPDLGIPLIFQDKTFVDADTIAAQDPTWEWGSNPGPTGAPVTGDLWTSSVYMPIQNPYDPSGASGFGRWHYGPWFWPPTTNILYPPIANEYFDPSCEPDIDFCEPPLRPDDPKPSMGMEAFMDTPVINGTLYPYLEVDPTVVRFRILNAANDRFINLQFFVADPSIVTDDGRMYTEVKMVPAQKTPGFPELWPTDGRVGGVPDPQTAGPSWIQIGNEGGFLPAPVVIPPQPMTFVTDAGLFNVGNVQDHSLLIGTAERADVLVDFSQFAGKTLILYNDSTAPFPAYDPRYDYYTGDEDLTSSGGTPTTQAGYGPNIRTVMQVRVKPADNPAGGSVHSIEVSNAGSGYSRVPSVSIFGGGGTGATATATGAVDRISVLDPGSGLTYPPLVYLVGGGGTGATAVANVSNGQIVNIQVTNGGSGYTTAPTVMLLSPIVGPFIYYLPLMYGGSGGGSNTPPTSLTAIATLRVDQITLTNGGANYTTAPIVQLVGGGGFGASAYANLGPGEMYDLAALEYVFMKTADKAGVFDAGQDRIIIPQAAYNSAYNETMPGAPARAFVQLHEFEKTFFNGPLSGLTLTNGGLGYTSAPAVGISGGGGTGAEATAVVDGVVTTLTLTNGGTGYTTALTVEFSGGGGTGAEATAGIVGVISTLTLTNGGTGYTSAPMVMFHGGGGTGAAATAVIEGGVITGLTLENPGTGYTSAPMVMFSGGGGTGAEATAGIVGGVTSLTLTNGGTGYTSAPTVTFLGGDGTGAEATAGIEGVITALILDNPGNGYTSIPTVIISGGGGSGATAVANGYTIPLEPKAIQDEMGEAFDEYGRMSGFLGLELPVTSAGAQVFVLYPYSSPPVDIMRDSSFTQLGSLEDGTQIWKITHNGVDTHTIHIHLVNAQLINRVAWDGLILPPDANELGWKETIRVNPLEHTIIAFRPTAPTQPFDIPNSIRLIDPSMPEGALLMGPPLGWQDPLGLPVVGGVLNQYVNFGWEYVYHCHLLSHEEMDMMHSLSFGVKPAAPTGASAVLNGTDVEFTWTDNSNNETYFTIFRSVSLDGPWAKAGTVKTGLPTTFTDTPPESGTYYYMVTASNLLGYIDNDTFVPFTNFPTEELISEPAFTEGGVVVP